MGRKERAGTPESVGVMDWVKERTVREEVACWVALVENAEEAWEWGRWVASSSGLKQAHQRRRKARMGFEAGIVEVAVEGVAVEGDGGVGGEGGEAGVVGVRGEGGKAGATLTPTDAHRLGHCLLWATRSRIPGCGRAGPQLGPPRLNQHSTFLSLPGLCCPSSALHRPFLASTPHPYFPAPASDIATR